jgi:hypothetical protein
MSFGAAAVFGVRLPFLCSMCVSDFLHRPDFRVFFEMMMVLANLPSPLTPFI